MSSSIAKTTTVRELTLLLSGILEELLSRRYFSTIPIRQSQLNCDEVFRGIQHCDNIICLSFKIYYYTQHTGIIEIVRHRLGMGKLSIVIDSFDYRYNYRQFLGLTIVYYRYIDSFENTTHTALSRLQDVFKTSTGTCGRLKGKP